MKPFWQFGVRGRIRKRFGILGIEMPDRERIRLKRLMRGSSCILEYGSGGSTLYAGRSGAEYVITTESDEVFLRRVIDGFPHRRGCELIPNYVDVGATGPWGYPIDSSHSADWHLYPESSWSLARERGLEPDLVVIDGRFRVACFLVSLSEAKPGTLLFWDDYGQRQHYHPVEKLIRPREMVGRAAIFEKRGETVPSSFIEEYYGDVR